MNLILDAGFSYLCILLLLVSYCKLRTGWAIWIFIWIWINVNWKANFRHFRCSVIWRNFVFLFWLVKTHGMVSIYSITRLDEVERQDSFSVKAWLNIESSFHYWSDFFFFFRVESFCCSLICHLHFIKWTVESYQV